MKTFSRILTVLGLALVLFAGILAFSARNLPATVLSEPREAEQTVQALADALNQGNFAQVGLLLYGTPALEDEPSFDNSFLSTVWEQYRSSLSCRLDGTCYVSGSGIYQDIFVEALDIQGALPEVEHRYQALLSELSQSEEAKTVYNDDGSYREDFVLSVLDRAAREVLSQDCASTELTVTLALVYRDSRWWILPQEGLMDILCGGFTGKEG